jgi:hypothetical protein
VLSAIDNSALSISTYPLIYCKIERKIKPQRICIARLKGFLYFIFSNGGDMFFANNSGFEIAAIMTGISWHNTPLFKIDFSAI